MRITARLRVMRDIFLLAAMFCCILFVKILPATDAFKAKTSRDLFRTKTPTSASANGNFISFPSTSSAITTTPTTSTMNPVRTTKTNLTVLWMYALDGSEHGWGRVPIGRLALEDINNSSNKLFPHMNYQLTALERPTQTYGLPDSFNIRATLKAFVQAVYDYPAQVYMIVGPMYTDEARTLAQLTPLYNLINVAGLATSPLLSDKQAYPLFFRTSQSDGDFKYTIAALMQKLNYSHYIGLYVNDPFAQDSAAVFEAYLGLRNISVETSIVFANNNASMVEVAKRFQKTVSRVVLLIAKGSEDARAVICTLAREFGVSGNDYVWFFVGFIVPNFPNPQVSDTPNCTAAELDRAINGSFWLDYGGLDVNDTVMVTRYRPSELAKRVDAYITKNYPNSVNQSVSPVAYREYDAFLAVAVALNNSAKELERRGLRIEGFDYSRSDIMHVFKEQLLACNFQGAAGPVRFQPNGDRIAIIRVLQYQPKPPIVLDNATELMANEATNAWVQLGWQVGSVNISAEPSELKLTKPLVFGTHAGLPPAGVQVRPKADVPATPASIVQTVLIAVLCGGVLPIMLLIIYLLRRHHLKTQLRNVHWLVDPREITPIGSSTNDYPHSAKSSPLSSVAYSIQGSFTSLHLDELDFGNTGYAISNNTFRLAYYQTTTKVCLFPLANLRHQLPRRPSLLTSTSVNSNIIWTAVTSSGRSNKISATSQRVQGQKLVTELKSNRILITQARLARECAHENVARFTGVLFNAQLRNNEDADNVEIVGHDIWSNQLHFAVYEWLNKGTLCELISAKSIDLDLPFTFSNMKDVASGLAYLHHKVGFHGRLKSTNVLVDKRLVCKLADYGLEKLQSNYLFVLATDADLLWTAPEILNNLYRVKSAHSISSSIRHNRKVDHPTLIMQRADVFSYAVIACELFTRQAPYTAWIGRYRMSHRQALEKVLLLASQHQRGSSKALDRNTIAQLLLASSADSETENSTIDTLPPEVFELLVRCTSPDASHRPTAAQVVDTIRRIMRQYHVSDNIMENLLRRLEQYAHNLETLVHEKTQAFFDEKKRAETLLYNILPRSVADQLKQGKSVEPESFECVTIYFSDIVGFTILSAESTPIEIIDLLNDLYNMFDSILATYDVYKVETIGDAYMVVSGLPQRNGIEHARQIALMSRQLVFDLNRQFRVRHKPDHRLQLRIGLHSGPCAAGVVGFVMPRYCLFGDTVNTASRMESTGEAMCVHISQDTQELLEKFFVNAATGEPEFICESRGEIVVKGKGVMNTYWLKISD